MPRDWTLYIVVDPGHQVCAVLFAALPPRLPPLETKLDPGLYGDYVYLIDELYLRDCNAAAFARAVKDKLDGRVLEASVIDYVWGRHSETGTGKSVAQQYGEALQVEQVKARRTGHGFIYASNDIAAGVQAVHHWLRAREDTPPKLRALEDKVPTWIWEIERYRKQRDSSGFVLDKPKQRGPVHLMDCLVAGTLVETDRGPRPIETIRAGDKVWTRQGVRPVAAAWESSKRTVYTVEMSDGRRITGTANHPVWVDRKEWVPLDCLRYRDIVEVWNEKQSLSTVSSTQKSDAARIHVLSVHREPLAQTVYNLQVDGDSPEYYANGILVHNCTRYLAAFNPAYVLPPPHEPGDLWSAFQKRKLRRRSIEEGPAVRLGPGGGTQPKIGA